MLGEEVGLQFSFKDHHCLSCLDSWGRPFYHLGTRTKKSLGPVELIDSTGVSCSTQCDEYLQVGGALFLALLASIKSDVGSSRKSMESTQQWCDVAELGEVANYSCSCILESGARCNIRGY